MPNKFNFLYKLPKRLNDDDYHHKENIVNACAKIIKKLMESREVICAAGFQSGKTDVMKRLIYVIQNYPDELKKLDIDIYKYNIYLISCVSSLDLKTQLGEKLPEIKNRIMHLPEIVKYINNITEYESTFVQMADSSLIIFDECHCDVEYENTIPKLKEIIKRFSKKNRTKYYKIGFSATPYEQIFSDIPKVIMKPSSGYYGLAHMFKKNKKTIPLIFQAKNLSDIDECKTLFEEIEVCDFYYIIRLPSKITEQKLVMDNVEKEIKKRKSSLDTYIYDMHFKGKINNLVSEKPSKPTVIFLKDKLRVGEHLDTKYVYLVHDDPKNMHTHTTVQSLVGRCCGYNKKNHETIIYCDYEKAWQHYKWVKNNYDADYLPEDCKYIKKNHSGIKSNYYHVK